VKRFIVIGAGAIGTYIGGRLAAADADLCFVGRQYSLDALGKNGLHVTDLDGFNSELAPDRLKLSTSIPTIAESEEAPIVLVCVKSGATEAVGGDIARSLPAGSTIISMQNGVDNVERLKAIAPQMTVLAGMVPYNVVMPTANHCHRATAGRLLIEKHTTTQAIYNLFSQAGLPLELRSDMREVQWGKLLLNLNNPINALSNLPLKAQLEDRGYRRALAALQLEALGVLNLAGIRPAKVGKVSPQLLPKLLCLPNGLFRLIAASMLKMDSKARSSMWVDLQAGKNTEIDDLCGAVVRLAKSEGVDAPMNRTITSLVKSFLPGQSWSGDELFKCVTRWK
jgi:2-dehydropantoate 2-reductase